MRMNPFTSFAKPHHLGFHGGVEQSEASRTSLVYLPLAEQHAENARGIYPKSHPGRAWDANQPGQEFLACKFPYPWAPHDTGIDEASELAGDMKTPRDAAGAPKGIHVSSVDVSPAIPIYQSALGLRGQLLQSAGNQQVAETMTANPGNEYTGAISGKLLLEFHSPEELVNANLLVGRGISGLVSPSLQWNSGIQS
jgi:hypothetical protein